MTITPAMLTRKEAARYTGLSLADFERAIFDGQLPQPVIGLGKRELWHRAKIDTALEKISGGQTSDWRAECGLYRAA